MQHQEIQALLELLSRLIFDVRTGGLMLLLLIAVVSDCRSHRIPNLLVLSGALFGVIYTTLVPPVIHGTALFPLGGLLVGLLLFLPLYLVGAMGAGDVKLLAMVGAFLGPLETCYAALATIFAGGVLSIIWVLARGRVMRLIQNLSLSFRTTLVGAVSGSRLDLRVAPEVSAGRLPYAIAIALGTTGFLVLNQLGLL